jgi:hypothetical protein
MLLNFSESELEREAFKTRLGGRSDDDLVWMKDLINEELRNRKFDDVRDKEFRICDIIALLMQ